MQYFFCTSYFLQSKCYRSCFWSWGDTHGFQLAAFSRWTEVSSPPFWAPPSPTGSFWFSSLEVWTIEHWDFFFYTYMSWHGSNLNRWNHKIIFSFFVRNSLRSLKFLDPKWYFAQFCDPIWAASLLVLDKWGTPLRNDPSAAAGICLNLAPVSTHSENWSKYSKIALRDFIQPENCDILD